MLDGRIDTHGTVKELQAQGVLEGIEHDTAVETHKEELVVAEEVAVGAIDEDSPGKIVETKKPRKLIKDEHREVGGVKWSIYDSYLKASSVPFLNLKGTSGFFNFSIVRTGLG